MNKSVSPIRISSIFANHKLIQNCRQKSKKIEPIQEFIFSFLDPDIAQEFVVASSDKDHIVLLVNSPAWATKIRYLTPLMLDNFAQHSQLNWIKKIDIKVAKQNQSKVQGPVIKSVRPSEQVCRHLDTVAESLTDRDLAAALKRIADKNRKGA